MLTLLRLMVFGLLLLAYSIHIHGVEKRTVDLSLGDSEAVMFSKMKGVRAQDVTKQTRVALYQSISGEQKCYWWELPDRVVVGVLLAGRTEHALKVVTIEIGEPNQGVTGIEHWRSQKLKSSSSIPSRRP